MGGDRTKPDWELAAEELCRHVRTLLDDHGSAIQEALQKTLTEDEAEAQLRQIELLIRVMEIELWRKGTTPDAKFGHLISSGLKKALATIGIVATTMATQDAYAALTAAEAKADQVIECVVRDDSQSGSAKDGQDPATAEAKAPAGGNVTEAVSLDHGTTPPSELVSVIDPTTKETTLRPRTPTRSRRPRNTS